MKSLDFALWHLKPQALLCQRMLCWTKGTTHYKEASAYRPENVVMLSNTLWPVEVNKCH